MYKYTALLTLLFAATLAVVHAEPPRFRAALRRAPGRFLARQQAAIADNADDVPPVVAADQPAPYPPAGVTPSIPFDLPTETEAPLPDEVYGPPEEEEPTPDPTYGPPEETTTLPTPADNAEGVIASENLIQPRRKPVLAKQRARGVVRSQPLILQAVPAAPGVVELVRAEPGVVYLLK
ncbi:translation initiation factor IF-2-like [Bactrocera tryoni]|uniref:translation initiation factor IF-2-like n=1 Tax=Bactrocera tryoni TaxID=59916 RepID=UPI001A9877E6|nr:translation initiation factor IF-2-like [Bactrocera tryoni]